MNNADGPSRDFWEAVFLADMQHNGSAQAHATFADFAAEEWAKRFVVKPVTVTQSPATPPDRRANTPAADVASAKIGERVYFEGHEFQKGKCLSNDPNACEACQRLGYHLVRQP
jgi:hypothetical protein